ncbi:MAG: DUF3387 domain-containing protein, partial [Candidatus Ratteibacteria bacterium]|nr:DUF3387 domain-containing protein [Candidatus Ratteibacteria bacterium]
LLTGFDDPVLQVMYLDKPLKEHRLLQAVARTNRPFKDVKEYGLVIDYIGILEEFKRSLEIYNQRDLKGVFYSTDEMKEEFISLIDKCLGYFPDIPKNKYDRDTLLKAFEVITSDEKTAKEFIQNVKLLKKKFELLGPDEIKAQLYEKYKWIIAVYIYYQSMIFQGGGKTEYYAEKYFKKTIDYIYKTIEVENIKKNMPLISFDKNYLEKLDKNIETTEEKAANIVFALNRLVLVEKGTNPVYESLSEKVERIVQMWKDKKKNYDEIYRQGVAIINEMEELTRKQKDLHLTDMEYSIYLVLKEKFPESDLIPALKELKNKLKDKIFWGWATQKTAVKEVEREIRRFLRRHVKQPYNLDIQEIDILSEKIKENIEKYGSNQD